jgi:nitroimidazol reductase NimA-like FMN-containing flavoprotein (pyridoxamine 5'-phosphate oxidase superfamily)
VNAPPADDPVLVALSRSECLSLLGGQCVGRIAYVDRDDLPVVVPVNYVVVDDTVLFRTHSGAKLDALRRRPVAFQVDAVDPDEHTGWSVLVQGVAHDAAPHELRGAHPEPWTAAGPYWIQIVPRHVSGRRISLTGDIT